MRNKRVLMTGATGFLGSNLLIALLENKYEVSILKRSFSDTFRIEAVQGKIAMYNMDEISIESCLEKAKPDIVIHCATDYGRKNVDPSVIIEANLILPLKLLELCRKNEVKCFINTDTFLDKGINYYSLSKKQFKDWLDTYSSDVICINIILEHFFGPFDDKTKFISFIIDEFLNNAEEINLTPGNQKRDFIYIDDIVNAFLCIIKNIAEMKNGLYNFGIGTNQQIEIKDLVKNIQKLTGNTKTKLNFGSIPYRKNEVMESVVDTKAIRSLGWSPQYSLNDGVIKTINAEKNKRI